ncbi:FAD-dependent oxidoreductase [Micromonospora profundi]|uniref:FAD-dependent oxidoreductase n=1 Tax=Micromonospora profundi TaxID=1420889 RepID=UPI003A907870
MTQVGEDGAGTISTSQKVAVVGAGVIGLCTGIRLRQAGLPVALFTRDSILTTTSASSGAIWGPFLSEMDPRVANWSYSTLAELTKLAEVPASGVELVSGIGAQRSGFSDDWWVASHDTALIMRKPPPGYADCWTYRVPIIDTPKYLAFLNRMLRSLGGEVHRQEITSIDEFQSGEYNHVVIAAGLGSGKLTNDPRLVPSRGQLVIVENPGIRQFFAERGDGPDLTYILPQGHLAVLGGTAEPGSTDLNPNEGTTREIINRCAAIEPRLTEAKVLSTRVGIRPCRDSVRLEHETAGRVHVVHNYGHGGSGISLSWGCADSVSTLVTACSTSTSSALSLN